MVTMCVMLVMVFVSVVSDGDDFDVNGNICLLMEDDGDEDCVGIIGNIVGNGNGNGRWY